VIQQSKRTAAATAGRMRASEKRLAARLEARGWVCVPPEKVTDEIRALANREDPESIPTASAR
jgi:hypothetical protein